MTDSSEAAPSPREDEKLREIKSRYREMPGIAFYQDDSEPSAELRELVRHCDRLSGELWPA